MPLRGRGIFSTGDAAIAAFLSGVGTPKAGRGAFVARNFLLDEGVSDARFQSYRAHGGVANHSTIGVWQQRHLDYLQEQVQIPGAGMALPSRIDPDDPAECPETFRDGHTASTFSAIDAKLDLLRVERFDFVAQYSGLSRKRFAELVDGQLANKLTADERKALDDALLTWKLQTDRRPVFAAFWEDMETLFDADSTPDWADRLRDRMGLAHLDPRAKAIEIVVFRYQVSRLPRITGSNTRPITPPTVLDGTHSEAFCPAPKGSLTGHTLDLNADSDLADRKEVLHPAIVLRSEDIFRRGSIQRPVERALLPLARHSHLESARTVAARPDYASETDGDLP